MIFPKLATQRLILSQLTSADSNDLLTIFSDQKVVRFYDIEAYESNEQALNLINFFNQRFAELAGIRWAIRLRESGQLVGTCGFNSWNPKMKNAGIGYELASDYWGQGYTSEALHKIISAAFAGQLPFTELHRIQADTMLGNHASEAVLRKLGFVEEGVRRGSGYWKGAFHDLKCFGLLKSDFIYE